MPNGTPRTLRQTLVSKNAPQLKLLPVCQLSCTPTYRHNDPLLTRLFSNPGCLMSTARFSSGTPSTLLWQVLYEDAILEFDNAKLPQRILQARSAIRDRVQEITDPSEHQLLDNALQSLEMLEQMVVRKRSA